MKAKNNLKTTNNLKATNKALTNAHVRPLANAADPRHFMDRRRNFAANAAFRPFGVTTGGITAGIPTIISAGSARCSGPTPTATSSITRCGRTTTNMSIRSGPTAMATSTKPIFSPYDYDRYVQGPGAPSRMATLTQGMAQSCDDEAAEVTGWPIDQIQSAVQPSPQQTALLDDLGNAIVQASHQIKIHCPTSVAFTPTARLDQMHQRLQALVDAVNVISPPLTKFYDSLSDEQKARFNDIAPPAPKNAQNTEGQAAGQQDQPSVQAQCSANVMAWPTDQIDSAIHPNDAQRAKLDALQVGAVAGWRIRSKPPVRPKCRRRRRTVLPRSATGSKPYSKASKRCSPRWRISIIRSATIRRRVSTLWASSCSRKISDGCSWIAHCAIQDSIPPNFRTSIWAAAQ